MGNSNCLIGLVVSNAWEKSMALVSVIWKMFVDN